MSEKFFGTFPPPPPPPPPPRSPTFLGKQILISDSTKCDSTPPHSKRSIARPLPSFQQGRSHWDVGRKVWVRTFTFLQDKFCKFCEFMQIIISKFTNLKGNLSSFSSKLKVIFSSRNRYTRTPQSYIFLILQHRYKTLQFINFTVI
jgi:hypothetical protein